MNAFQTCHNTSDAIPLYLPQQLYLKPIARLNISLQLPQRTMGKSISNWEVMEKLRLMIRPEEFSILKVTKTNLEFIRFEAEIENKKELERVISKLDNKMIKLKEFPELLKVRACETKLHFPTRHNWDTFFREAKDMNEMKAGERPDTIHISNLPIKWFVPYHLSGEEDLKPSEKIFYRVFEKFGNIRRIDIPICDPYRSKMKAEVSGMQIFSFNEEHLFEGYVQFKDYVGFTKTMDALRGMKLLHKDDESHTISINVDFDRTKHLSDASIRRREIVRDRLVQKEIDCEEKLKQQEEEEQKRVEAERQKEKDQKLAKERRRREREEKRKAKILAKLKVKGADEIHEKIAKEEKKLLKVQRKLEAIRLVEELFKRIKVKKEASINLNSNKNDDTLTKFKLSSEEEVRQQTEKLNRVIEGRIILKSILSGGPHISKYNSSSSESSENNDNIKQIAEKRIAQNMSINSSTDSTVALRDWYNYPSSDAVYPYQMTHMYPPPIMSGHPSNYFSYSNRGRGFHAGPSQGVPNNYIRRPRGRYRGNYHPKSSRYTLELQKQYYRYFEKFLHEHKRNRPGRSLTKSRSRSRSRHRSSSSRRSRSRSSSYSHHHSRYQRSRSRSRSKSRSYKSRSRRSSSDRSKSQRNRSSKTSSKTDRRKSSDKHKSRSPSYKSIDSSKFISPSRLRIASSKSWSLPKENDKSKRSWSKSLSPETPN